MRADAEADRIAGRLRELSSVPVDPSPIIRTARTFYGVSLRDLERVARAWLGDHSEASAGEILDVADALWERAIREEMVVAAFVAGARHETRRRFGTRRLDRWGALLDTWETTDNLGARVVGPWAAGDPERALPVLERLAGRRNPYLRRLALVGCVYLGRLPDAERWFPRVAAIVLRLSGDREASMPKAISWVLRTHLRFARSAVAAFLEEHGEDLPAIARRETTTKMATGTKTGRPRLR